MTFGSYIKACRLAHDLTLREAALRSGIPVSDWSKMERDVNTAPKTPATKLAVINTLGLEAHIGTVYWQLEQESLRTLAPKVTEDDIAWAYPIFKPLTDEQVLGLRSGIIESLTRNLDF